MKNGWASFIIVAFIILAVAGGAIYLNKSKTKQADTPNNQSEDIDDSADSPEAKYKEDLAKYLTENGAVLYGAYWCPHCNDQKKMFGDAAKYLNYVECDSRGQNPNPDECVARGVQSYPTWIYQDQQYSGTQSLAKLAEIVGYIDSTQPPQATGNNVSDDQNKATADDSQE